MDALIYKIFAPDEWAEFARAGRFEGSAADKRDGFIHFSTRGQLPGTLERYYAAEDRVAVAAFRADAFGQDLKWERSRDDADFPHLYASLSIDQVESMEWIGPKAPLATGAKS